MSHIESTMSCKLVYWMNYVSKYTIFLSSFLFQPCIFVSVNKLIPRSILKKRHIGSISNMRSGYK